MYVDWCGKVELVVTSKVLCMYAAIGLHTVDMYTQSVCRLERGR